MASIELRSGSWRVKVRRIGVSRSGTFKTREDAENWAAIQEREAYHELPHVPLKDAETVAQALRHSAPIVIGSGVYLLFSGVQLIYIGESARVMSRILQHQKNGRRFDRFAAIPCEPIERKTLEAELIRRLKPNQNAWGINGATTRRTA